MDTPPILKTSDMPQYRRDYYAARKARGVCPGCARPLRPDRKAEGRVYCKPCVEARS